MEGEQNTNWSQMGTPIAIVVAGGLIAVALYFSGGAAAGPAQKPQGGQPAQKTITAADIVPVSASDHILGDPNAPIKIIEYTDLECPFCKQFHGTMKQVMATYGAEGKVAWIIRNFPLEQLHPNAPKLAEAAECAAELGGGQKYFAFVDEIIRQAPINTFFDMTKLDSAATAVGVDAQKFAACVKSGKYQSKIQGQIQDAIRSGGQGTPHNILIDKKGNPTLIAGAQPLEVVKGAIEGALK